MAASDASRNSGRALDLGLICSIAGPERKAPPLSVWADGRSALESVLNTRGWETPALLARARGLLDFKTRHRLSRFNDAQPLSAALLPVTRRQRVLVVEDDRSLAISGPTEPMLKQRLQIARAEFPQAQLILLRARGASSRLPFSPETSLDVVLNQPADLVDLVSRVDAVVSCDLVGLEALLVGRTVVCEAPSIYGGWGLTIDRAGDLPARAQSRSLEELFAAAYILCARYVDPLTGMACEPEVALERLAAFKHHAGRVAGRWRGVALQPPKQTLLARFLAGPTSSFSASSRAGAASEAIPVTWATQRGRVGGFDDQSAGAVKVEDGFIRSVGLGSNMHPAGSIVLDRRGIYYDPATASDLETILNETAFSADLVGRARTLRERILATGLSKYNLPDVGAAAPGGGGGSGRVAILVPGQVEDDASILTGGGGRSNLWLLEEVRSRNPDARITFKEHPDVTAGNRRGAVAPEALARLADAVADRADIAGYIAEADEVHTLTSLAGFEGLIRGKTVVTYGLPFYGGWGLTTDRLAYPRPRRMLTLDELVAGCLMLYPLYLDPVSGLPCDALFFVERLAQLRDRGGPSPSLASDRLLRPLRALAQSIRRPAPLLY
jgi:capsular polysaccharide export protein